jgi:hypothetical protein
LIAFRRSARSILPPLAGASAIISDNDTGPGAVEADRENAENDGLADVVFELHALEAKMMGSLDIVLDASSMQCNNINELPSPAIASVISVSFPGSYDVS